MKRSFTFVAIRAVDVASLLQGSALYFGTPGFQANSDSYGHHCNKGDTRCGHSNWRLPCVG